MKADDRFSELRRGAEKSRRLLPIHALFLLITTGLSLALEIIFDPSWVVHLLILWVGPFMLIVDVVNIIYCRRALSRAGRTRS